MALTLLTTIHNYIGVNADIATLSVVDIPTGSKFIALDTGARRIFNGTAWVVDLTDVVVSAQTLDPASNNMATGFYPADTLSNIDTDLATANIKAGKTIFGIAGKTEVVDTTEVAVGAVAADIALNKKAWVNGVEITGTHV